MKQKQQNALLAQVILALVGAWSLPMVGSTVGLAFKLQEQTESTAIYSGVIAAGWLVNMLGLGFFGWLSDRELLKTNSRTKLLLLSTLLLIPCGFAFGGVSSATDLIIIWLVYQVPSSALITVTMAIAGDKLDGKILGLASGLIGSAPAIGLLLGLASTQIAGPTDFSLFALPAVLAVVLAVPLAIYYPSVQEGGDRLVAVDDYRSPFSLKRIVTVVAVVSIAAATIQIYPLSYVTLVLNAKAGWLESEGQIHVIVASLAAVAGNLIVGLAIKSIKEAKVTFILGAIVQALGLLLLCANDASKLYPVAYAIAALGVGASLGSSISLALYSFGRKQNIGRSLGFINAAQTLPYILVPGLTGFFIVENSGSLLGLFVWTAVFSLVSIPLLLVKKPS